jgi:hypothetical protein
MESTKLSPAEQLRIGRNLANVQRLQSEFWQALRDLEDTLSEVCDDTCSLVSSIEYNDLTVTDVLSGQGWEGR